MNSNDNHSINIYDIAKLAGVSIATVSRVVNGSPKVSAKTKERVLDIIEREGYTPNVFAQGLGLNTMHTIGILVPSIADQYMSSAVAIIEEQLHSEGYDCILSCSGFSAEQKEAHIQLLLSKKIDALILVGSTYAGSDESSHNTDYIRKAAAEIPVFLINGLVEGENIYCTASNDYQASLDVTTTLLENGKKRILFMTDSKSYSAKQKLAGYMQACKNYGIPVDEKLIIHTKNSIHLVRDLLLAEDFPSFDSVFATDDAMAVGAIKYAAAKGLRIPEDLWIIGYNNSILCISSEPELTSVDNRVEKVCTDTVNRLLTILKGNKNISQQNVIACTLSKRATTGF